MGKVGVYIHPSDDRCRVVATCGVRLAEDAYEVRDPLLVSLSGQQCHNHQLDAQKHEKVAPSGLDADHGGGSASSKQHKSGGGSAQSRFGLKQLDLVDLLLKLCQLLSNRNKNQEGGDCQLLI